MGYTIKFYDDLSKEVIPDGGGITPPPELDGDWVFILADDFLPPQSLMIKGIPSTDVQLKEHPELWPFSYWREHRKAPSSEVVNLPATCLTVKKEMFVHSNSLMWYWADNLCLSWYNKYHVEDLNEIESIDFFKKFDWLSKSTEIITNHKGIQDGYYSVVLDYGQQMGYFDSSVDVNVGATPVGIDPLLTERNIVKLVDTVRRRIGTTTGYLFHTLNGDNEFPRELVETQKYRTNPEYFSMANILLSKYQKDENGGKYLYKPNGHLGLNPFPMGWEHNAHTPLPNVSKTETFGSYTMVGGVNMIAENRIHLTDGYPTLIKQIPNPYNPPVDLR